MSWVKVGVVGVASGIVDDQMEKWDAKKGRTKPFQNATDLYRAAAVVGGVVVPMFVRNTQEWGKTVTTANLALLTKSVIRAVSSTMGTSTGSFAARRSISHSIADNMTRPEFEGQRSY